MYTKQSYANSSAALNPNQSISNAADNSVTKLYKQEVKKARQDGLSHLYNNDYKPASYKKAVLFRDSMSYRKKISEDTYKQLDLFEDTNELKSFGLGPYFFVQFQRRITWLFLLLSIIQAIRIYINLQGTGLTEYQGGFGTYLVTTTIGNYTKNVLTNYDQYIMTIVPCAVYLIVFMFYIWWKCHYNSCINEEEESRDFIKPEKFCVEIQGFDPTDDVKEEELEELFSSFGPIYEVCLARQYDGCLKHFEQLDALEEEIKQEELEIILGSGDSDNLRALKKQKEELSKYVNTLHIKPSTRSAYIHFQFQKSKVDMLQYYSDHYLFLNKNSHSCMRGICCCCIDDPEPKYLYRGKKLYIKTEKVPEPEDINWNSYEIGVCGKLFRFLFSAFIIIVFLAISCTIIGLCSIYISSHSVSCQGVSIPSTLTIASSVSRSDKEMKCYCSANLIASFNDQGIKSFCGGYLTSIYTQQGIQYAIIVTSTIVNIIFGIIVKKLVDFTEPTSLSTGYLLKTSINTIFMIFNTVFLPLLIYADIFGFKATKYVSFITIVSTDISTFFQVDSISFYTDFQKIWYRNVSPIYVNFLILNTVLTWVFFILFKCCCTKASLESKQGAILQKSMNEQIIQWKLGASDDFAEFNMIIFLTLAFSGGIPVLIPLGFCNLFSKYVANRSLLQSVSSRVPGLSQSFNAFPFSMIPFLLIFANLIGSWMTTSNSLIYSFTNMKISLPVDWWILNRMLIVPFFLILAIIVAFQFLFSNILIRLCSWISESCYDRKTVVHPYYTRQYSHYAKSMSILHSFNIRNNLKYKNAIINLEKYLYVQESKN